MILIVEDDADTARLLVRLLGSRGWDVLAVDNGREALAVLAGIQASCVVLDYMLPDMNGIDVLKAYLARPSPRDKPVVFYSATADAAVQATAEAAGAKAWVRKVGGITGLTAAVEPYCMEMRAYRSGPDGGGTGDGRHIGKDRGA